MKWNVVGTAGGKAALLLIEAPSEEDATRRATAGGVRVASVSSAEAGEGGPTDACTRAKPIANSPAARVPCPVCAELIMPAASMCPFCKQAIFSKHPGRNALIGTIVFIVFSVVVYIAFTAYIRYESKREMETIMRDAEVETDRLMKRAEREADEIQRRLSK